MKNEVEEIGLNIHSNSKLVIVSLIFKSTGRVRCGCGADHLCCAARYAGTSSEPSPGRDARAGRGGTAAVARPSPRATSAGDTPLAAQPRGGAPLSTTERTQQQ